MKSRNALIALGVAAALAVGAYGVTASAQGGPGFGQGYGPGMMDGYGPGNGPGYGPMQGYGPGYDRRGDVQGNQTLNLSTDDVKGRMERWLNWRGNARLKVGEVKEKDADTITADVVTKDNSLVQRFIVDRHTGNYRQSED